MEFVLAQEYFYGQLLLTWKLPRNYLLGLLVMPMSVLISSLILFGRKR